MCVFIIILSFCAVLSLTSFLREVIYLLREVEKTLLTHANGLLVFDRSSWVGRCFIYCISVVLFTLSAHFLFLPRIFLSILIPNLSLNFFLSCFSSDVVALLFIFMIQISPFSFFF